MKFSLIICTYMRPQPLLLLLQSVQEQTIYPNEILIIDGSTNQETEKILKESPFDNLNYFRVPTEHRGLTKQRNFGIERVGNEIEVVCFLDDDIVLENDYFEQLLKTYTIFPEALGVGGYIIDETKSEFVGDNYQPKIGEYFLMVGKEKTEAALFFEKNLA